ncbi:MAG TPA: hypothetical protein VFW87_13010, partial [Pirellulales bacterium]|nr:hypothetical protein [Pirellulales bacterium]
MRNSFIRAFSLARFGFEPSRLCGVSIVAAGGLTIYALMHFVLGYALGHDAAALHPRQRLLGWPLYERVSSRVAAIDHLYRSGQMPRDTRLGVCLGVSTNATGIERRFLDARATVADRWIVLSGAGLSFENLEGVMLPVFFCSLKPSAVVFSVHPQMLVGERFMNDAPTLGDQPVVGRRRRALKSRFASIAPLGGLPKHWIVENHAIVGHFLNTQFYAWRLGVFYLAGVSAEGFCPPATEPWDDDPWWLWNMNDAEHRFAHEQIAFWRKQGHFKAANYNPDGDQAQSFVRMIRAYRELGAKVYVLLMPLRSTLRELVPENAKPCLYEVLNREFPDEPPT